MPETLKPESFTKETADNIRKYHKGDYKTSRTVAEILKSDANYVGEGTTTVAATEKNNKNKLIVVNNIELSPESAKTTYYTQRVLTTLFPDNFPKISASAGSTLSKEHVSYSFREMARGEEIEQDRVNKMLEGTSKNPKDRRFHEIKMLVEKLELPIDFDPNCDNYIETTDAIVYIDTFNSGDWDDEIRNNLLNFMHSESFEHNEIEQVGNAVNRIISINSQQN